VVKSYAGYQISAALPTTIDVNPRRPSL